MSAEQPIAWTALQRGAPVRARDGESIGTVAEVVADEDKDIFSGLAVDTGAFRKTVFVPAEHVAELTDEAVTLDLGSAEVEALETYE